MRISHLPMGLKPRVASRWRRPSGPGESAVFPRSEGGSRQIATGGEGMTLFDEQGKSYLDAAGGVGSMCLGYSEQRLVDVLAAQAEELPFAHTAFFNNAPLEALAEELLGHAPQSLTHVCILSTGSDAVEAALKMARQYAVESGNPERHRIIARRQSYHGATLGTLSVGYHESRRAIYQPLLLPIEHVSPCYAYRERAGDEDDFEYGRRLAQELEETILRLGEDTVLAFLGETVVGATLGAVAAVPGYWKAIREVCDRYGVLLILDEVMCGVGRTGSFFAFEQEGIEPDIVTLGKSLSAGYQPIGAVIASQDIGYTLSSGFQHGQTFMGHPLTCAVAHRTLEILRDDGLLELARTQGELLGQDLHAALDDHPLVGDVRGRGMFWGIELVADPDSRQPFPAQLKMAEQVKRACRAEGLLVYPGSGTADGRVGDHVLLLPPYIMNDEERGQVVARLSRALSSNLRTA